MQEKKCKLSIDKRPEMCYNFERNKKRKRNKYKARA